MSRAARWVRTDIGVDFAEGGTVAVRGVVHTNDQSLTGAVNDDTLGRFALFFATALDEGGTTIIIVHFTTSERVLLARAVEAFGGDRIKLLALEESGQFRRLIDLHL